MKLDKAQMRVVSTGSGRFRLPCGRVRTDYKIAVEHVRWCTLCKNVPTIIGLPHIPTKKDLL